MQETQVQSLGQEDPLEKEMATQTSILAWEIPWTEEPEGLQSMGLQELDKTQWLNDNYCYMPGTTQAQVTNMRPPRRMRGEGQTHEQI